MFKKSLSLLVVFCFFLTSLGPLPKADADMPLDLPQAGSMINLSPAYEPVIIKGLTVHKDNPFLFDFIVDVGQDRMSGQPLKQEGEKLIKYFLASLAIPDKDVWVNLSPYEKSRMIPDALSQTDMGRDLLEQDYILKQITASLIYPEKKLGKTFWDKVYAKSQAMYGTTQIPVNTFNKVWIMADRAEVFEHNQTAFVVDSHLKVMLEEDYLALSRHSSKESVILSAAKDLNKINSLRDSSALPQNDKTHSIASQIIKQIILPELEKEVNTGKNFANLRQIFNSIILSSWYKRSLKQALLNQVYANKSKVKGINLSDPTIKEQIYNQYLKAYKKGVFNYIKEDINTANNQVTPRKYFSGGISPAQAAEPKVTLNPKDFNSAMTFGHPERLLDFATITETNKPSIDQIVDALATNEENQRIVTEAGFTFDDIKKMSKFYREKLLKGEEYFHENMLRSDNDEAEQFFKRFGGIRSIWAFDDKTQAFTKVFNASYEGAGLGFYYLSLPFSDHQNHRIIIIDPTKMPEFFIALLKENPNTFLRFSKPAGIKPNSDTAAAQDRSWDTTVKSLKKDYPHAYDFLTRSNNQKIDVSLFRRLAFLSKNQAVELRQVADERMRSRGDSQVPTVEEPMSSQIRLTTLSTSSHIPVWQDYGSGYTNIDFSGALLIDRVKLAQIIQEGLVDGNLSDLLFYDYAALPTDKLSLTVRALLAKQNLQGMTFEALVKRVENLTGAVEWTQVKSKEEKERLLKASTQGYKFSSNVSLTDISETLNAFEDGLAALTINARTGQVMPCGELKKMIITKEKVNPNVKFKLLLLLDHQGKASDYFIIWTDAAMNTQYPGLELNSLPGLVTLTNSLSAIREKAIPELRGAAQALLQDEDILGKLLGVGISEMPEVTGVKSKPGSRVTISYKSGSNVLSIIVDQFNASNFEIFTSLNGQVASNILEVPITEADQLTTKATEFIKQQKNEEYWKKWFASAAMTFTPAEVMAKFKFLDIEDGLYKKRPNATVPIALPSGVYVQFKSVKDRIGFFINGKLSVLFSIDDLESQALMNLLGKELKNNGKKSLIFDGISTKSDDVMKKNAKNIGKNIIKFLVSKLSVEDEEPAVSVIPVHIAIQKSEQEKEIEDLEQRISNVYALISYKKEKNDRKISDEAFKEISALYEKARGLKIFQEDEFIEQGEINMRLEELKGIAEKILELGGKDAFLLDEDTLENYSWSNGDYMLRVVQVKSDRPDELFDVYAFAGGGHFPKSKRGIISGEGLRRYINRLNKIDKTVYARAKLHEVFDEMMSNEMVDKSKAMSIAENFKKGGDIIGLHGIFSIDAVKDTILAGLTPEVETPEQTVEVRKTFLVDYLAQTVTADTLLASVNEGSADYLISKESLSKEVIDVAREAAEKLEKSVLIIAQVDNKQGIEAVKNQIDSQVSDDKGAGADGVKIKPAGDGQEGQTEALVQWFNEKYPNKVIMVAGKVKKENRLKFKGAIAGIGPDSPEMIPQISLWGLTEKQLSLFGEVCDFLREEYALTPERIFPRSRLIEDLGFSSTEAVVGLFESLKEEYGIPEITDEEGSRVNTVLDIVTEYLEKNVSEAMTTTQKKARDRLMKHMEFLHSPLPQMFGAERELDIALTGLALLSRPSEQNDEDISRDTLTGAAQQQLAKLKAFFQGKRLSSSELNVLENLVDLYERTKNPEIRALITLGLRTYLKPVQTLPLSFRETPFKYLPLAVLNQVKEPLKKINWAYFAGGMFSEESEGEIDAVLKGASQIIKDAQRKQDQRQDSLRLVSDIDLDALNAYTKKLGTLDSTYAQILLAGILQGIKKEWGLHEDLFQGYEGIKGAFKNADRDLKSAESRPNILDMTFLDVLRYNPNFLVDLFLGENPRHPESFKNKGPATIDELENMINHVTESKSSESLNDRKIEFVANGEQYTLDVLQDDPVHISLFRARGINPVYRLQLPRSTHELAYYADLKKLLGYILDDLRAKKSGTAAAPAKEASAAMKTVKLPADFKPMALLALVFKHKEIGNISQDLGIGETPLALSDPKTSRDLERLSELVGLKIRYHKAKLIFTSDGRNTHDVAIGLFRTGEGPLPVAIISLTKYNNLLDQYATLKTWGGRAWFGHFNPDTVQIIQLADVSSRIDSKSNKVFIRPFKPAVPMENCEWLELGIPRDVAVGGKNFEVNFNSNGVSLNGKTVQDFGLRKITSVLQYNNVFLLENKDRKWFQLLVLNKKGKLVAIPFSEIADSLGKVEGANFVSSFSPVTGDSTVMGGLEIGSFAGARMLLRGNRLADQPRNWVTIRMPVFSKRFSDFAMSAEEIGLDHPVTVELGEKKFNVVFSADGVSLNDRDPENFGLSGVTNVIRYNNVFFLHNQGTRQFQILVLTDSGEFLAVPRANILEFLGSSEKLDFEKDYKSVEGNDTVMGGLITGAFADKRLLLHPGGFVSNFVTIDLHSFSSKFSYVLQKSVSRLSWITINGIKQTKDFKPREILRVQYLTPSGGTVDTIAEFISVADGSLVVSEIGDGTKLAVTKTLYFNKNQGGDRLIGIKRSRMDDPIFQKSATVRVNDTYSLLVIKAHNPEDEKSTMGRTKVFVLVNGRVGDERIINRPHTETPQGTGAEIIRMLGAGFDVSTVDLLTLQLVVLNADNAQAAPHWNEGGIDLSTSSGMRWKISEDGKGVEMDVDPALIARVRNQGIDSLSETVFSVTPIRSIWSMMGLQAPVK